MSFKYLVAPIVLLTAVFLASASTAEAGTDDAFNFFAEESLTGAAHASGGDPEATVQAALRFLSRGGDFELTVEKTMTHLAQTRYRARFAGGTLTLLNHPSGLSLLATARESVPELWDETTGLSFFIMDVTTFAVAGYVTRWEGPRAVEQADFRILPADLSGMNPLARLLLERSGYGIRRELHRLPIDARFAFLEKVPFWTRTPRRAAYQAILLFDGYAAANVVIDNDAAPGRILSVAATALSQTDFDRTVWPLFPYP